MSLEKKKNLTRSQKSHLRSILDPVLRESQEQIYIEGNIAQAKPTAERVDKEVIYRKRMGKIGFVISYTPSEHFVVNGMKRFHVAQCKTLVKFIPWVVAAQTYSIREMFKNPTVKVESFVNEDKIQEMLSQGCPKQDYKTNYAYLKGRQKNQDMFSELEAAKAELEALKKEKEDLKGKGAIVPNSDKQGGK